jgi:hypothetical protein
MLGMCRSAPTKGFKNSEGKDKILYLKTCQVAGSSTNRFEAHQSVGIYSFLQQIDIKSI